MSLQSPDKRCNFAENQKISDMQNNPVQQVISFLNHCILSILHDDSRIDTDSLANLPQQHSQRNERSQDKSCHEDSHAYRSFHRKIFDIIIDDVVDQRNVQRSISLRRTSFRNARIQFIIICRPGTDRASAYQLIKKPPRNVRAENR